MDSAGISHQYYSKVGQRDSEIAAQRYRDSETARQRDSETARKRESETATQNTGDMDGSEWGASAKRDQDLADVEEKRHEASRLNLCACD